MTNEQHAAQSGAKAKAEAIAEGMRDRLGQAIAAEAHDIKRATDYIDGIKCDVERLRETLKAIKIRIAFIGHPSEPRDNADRPCWKHECRLIEIALKATEEFETKNEPMDPT